MDISGISAVASANSASGSNTNDYMDKLADKIIAQKDIDKDGSISIEEAKLPKEIFSFIDKDGNGKVSKEELKTSATDIKNNIMSLGELLVQANKSPAPDKLQSLLGNLQNANTITDTAAKDVAKTA